MENHVFVNCDLCGSSSYKVVYPALTNIKIDVLRDLKASGNEICADQIVECTSCGLKYVNPMIEPKLIVAGYAAGSDELFVAQADEREATFDRTLRKIEKYLSKGKLLDIGTASGAFLSAAKRRGYDVTGIEPNTWLVNWAKKHSGISTIYPGTIFTHKFQKQSFDIVTMWDVLEHVTNPKETLLECGKVMKPGGTLLINYPDVGSLPAKVMGRKWPFVLAVHLYYFDKKSLTKVLRSAGFDVVTIKSHTQTLRLGYLCYRLEKYNKFFGRLSGNIAKLLHINNLRISYYLGQKTCIAKKLS